MVNDRISEAVEKAELDTSRLPVAVKVADTRGVALTTGVGAVDGEKEENLLTETAVLGVALGHDSLEVVALLRKEGVLVTRFEGSAVNVASELLVPHTVPVELIVACALVGEATEAVRGEERETAAVAEAVSDTTAPIVRAVLSVPVTLADAESELDFEKLGDEELLRDARTEAEADTLSDGLGDTDGELLPPPPRPGEADAQPEDEGERDSALETLTDSDASAEALVLALALLARDAAALSDKLGEPLVLLETDAEPLELRVALPLILARDDNDVVGTREGRLVTVTHAVAERAGVGAAENETDMVKDT